ARDVEEVVDELGLGPDAALENADGPGSRRRVVATALQDADPREHRRERRAELVGQGGEEGVLRLVGPGGLGPGLLERLRRPLGRRTGRVGPGDAAPARLAPPARGPGPGHPTPTPQL